MNVTKDKESHLPEGTLLQGGKYRIVRFIGSGGFGCTYQIDLNRSIHFRTARLCLMG